MGPLVPYIFSNEFSLVIAVIIGMAFGFILEQAGFSSTKKLVGLFYGYDFTVLRVFFTAGVTAMTGVLLLAHYGLLDMSVIYINPTFLRSAIVGGLIMGAGFIVGGFCPGTSVCAAAIGKIDAMAFIVGSLIGVFAFTESYPAIESFFMADNMGDLTMYDQLGISNVLFGFLLSLMAVAAFFFTWLIENKVNKRDNSFDKSLITKYILGFSFVFIIIMIVAFLPGKKDIIEMQIANAKKQKKCVFHEISADKLGYEIAHNYFNYNIIDVRKPEEFEKFHLPLAINIPFDELMNREWETIFKQRIKTNVFYADNDTLVRMSCLKAKFIGNSTNLILKEQAEEFKSLFFEIAEPQANASKDDIETYHYRSQTAMKMNDLVKSFQNAGKTVKKEIKKVKGGCS